MSRSGKIAEMVGGLSKEVAAVKQFGSEVLELRKKVQELESGCSTVSLINRKVVDIENAVELMRVSSKKDNSCGGFCRSELNKLKE